MRGRWDLKDEEWALVEPLLRPVRREDNRGRPWRDTRMVLNGVLWLLGTGAHWRELPDRYPPYQTCHRRFRQWIRSGRLEELLKRLAALLHEQGKLNLDEAFVDATFASAKKGGLPSVPPVGARARKSSLSPPATVFLSPLLSKAQRTSECRLVETVPAGSFLDELPTRLIGDKAYVSDGLDAQLAEEYGIELIAPNRRGRKCSTRDGRKLRRYRRRWKIERLFAWLHTFRRLVTRWEYHIENFLGFVHLGCLKILLRCL